MYAIFHTYIFHFLAAAEPHPTPKENTLLGSLEDPNATRKCKGFLLKVIISHPLLYVHKELGFFSLHLSRSWPYEWLFHLYNKAISGLTVCTTENSVYVALCICGILNKYHENMYPRIYLEKRGEIYSCDFQRINLFCLLSMIHLKLSIITFWLTKLFMVVEMLLN